MSSIWQGWVFVTSRVGVVKLGMSLTYWRVASSKQVYMEHLKTPQCQRWCTDLAYRWYYLIYKLPFKKKKWFIFFFILQCSFLLVFDMYIFLSGETHWVMQITPPFMNYGGGKGETRIFGLSSTTDSMTQVFRSCTCSRLILCMHTWLLELNLEKGSRSGPSNRNSSQYSLTSLSTA